ncbi:MAG: hypothetical protein Kow0058_15060 [Roseovarius sp.]
MSKTLRILMAALVAGVTGVSGITTLIGAIGAGATPAAAAASVPASGALIFDVLRKGRDIGDYAIRFQPQGDVLTVQLKTDVAVRFLGIPAYVFTQDSTETWKDGRLISLRAVTNDNGQRHDIRLGASDVLPASLWNAAIVKARRALNTIDGHEMAIRVARIGDERVDTGHGPVAATHYRLSGDLARDLWFAADGTLVKVAFVGDDGSAIAYRLR